MALILKKQQLVITSFPPSKPETFHELDTKEIKQKENPHVIDQVR